MNTDRDELDELFKAYGIGHVDSRVLANAMVQIGYRKQQQVTTVEDLNALPVGTIVLDSESDVCERMSFGWYVIVKEEGASPWLLDGAEDVELPATVLHVGTDAV